LRSGSLRRRWAGKGLSDCVWGGGYRTVFVL
jgi:hypothetical protein